MDHRAFSEQGALQRLAQSLDELTRRLATESLAPFAQQILNKVCEELQAPRGVFYAYLEEEAYLEAIAAFGLRLDQMPRTRFAPGEGVVGESIQTAGIRYFGGLEPGTVTVSAGSHDINIEAMALLPLRFNEKLYGLLELELLHDAYNKDLLHHHLDEATRHIAANLQGLLTNQRLQKLLEETRHQDQLREANEKLRAREEEMRQIQAELERTADFNRVLLENVYEPIFVLEEERISMANGALLTLLGAEHKESLLGQSLSDISPQHQPDGRASTQVAKSLLHRVRAEGHAASHWQFRGRGQENVFRAKLQLSGFEYHGKWYVSASLHHLDKEKEEERPAAVASEGEGISVPPKNRPEWKELLTGRSEQTFHNFVLQMKMAQFHRQIAAGKIELDQAIDQFHQLCRKYAVAAQEDFRNIFKTW